MPYTVTNNHPDCEGWALVKDATNEVVGCHKTQSQAEDQLTAINISEFGENRAEGYAPNDGMKNEAQKGLDWRDEFGRGGTEVGIARARDIVNGRNLSLDTINRMVSFFARHEVDKEAEGFSPGEEGYPSNGRIAWALWGGDAGKSWSEKIANQNRTDDRKRFDTALQILKDLQKEV